MRALLISFVLLPLSAIAEIATPYAGQETRALKALSAAEVKAYLEGQGMGLSKAAELNRYPGPRHVLDFASQLQLSAAQTAATQNIYARMHSEAVRLGAAIVAREQELDRLFAHSAPAKLGNSSLEKLSARIAKLQGELRLTHLRAHVETAALLTPAQIDAYDKLRGYNRTDAPRVDDAHQHQH